MSLFDRLFSSPDRASSAAAPATPRKPLLKADGTPYELALYAYDSCGFCQRVFRTVGQLGIEVELRNTMRDPKHRRDLVEATGRGTVPCLFIDGEPMHESSDIVAWLNARAAEQPA